MTRDDIIRMAREVGFQDAWVNLCGDNFERFAALVAAAECEACARIAEAEQLTGMAPSIMTTGEVLAVMVTVDKTKESIAAAIRARGEKGGAL